MIINAVIIITMISCAKLEGKNTLSSITIIFLSTKKYFLNPTLKTPCLLFRTEKNTQIWWASELLQKIKGFKTKAKKIPRRRTKVSHFQETLWIIFRQRDACAGRGKMETLQTTSDNIKRLQTTWSSSLVILRTIYSSWLSDSWDPLEMKTLCIVKLLYHLRIESNVLGIIFSPVFICRGMWRWSKSAICGEKLIRFCW